MAILEHNENVEREVITGEFSIATTWYISYGVFY